MNPEFHATDGKIEDEARAWVRRLSSGRATKADARRLEQWCARSPSHQTAFERARQEWQAIGPLAQTYRSLYRESAPVAVKSPGRRWFMGAGLTAMGALTVVAAVRPPLGLWPSWSELGADYRTATGEQRDVQIGTHIRVALNTQTSIAVQGRGNQLRIELIAGEAAIVSDGAQALEVVSGAGRVQLANGCVEVRRLGGDQVRVACVEGQAQLQHGARSLALQAGQQVVYDAQMVSGVANHVSTTLSAWRDGMVDFDNTPLAQAVAEINRYRPGRVVLMNDALARQRISGRFKVDALNQAITLIEQLYQAKVRRLGDVVLLS